MADAPVKRRRGCLFYGCLTGVIGLVIILVGVLIGLHQLRKMVYGFTDSQPMTLPTVKLSTAQIDEVRKRVGAFGDAVKAGTNTPPLELSGEEVAALIASEPSVQPMHDKFYVTIEGDQLKGQISLPLAELRLLPLKGRYLNANGTFVVALHGGALFVTPQNLEVKGKPIPATYMEALRKQNLAAQVNADTNAAAALGRLQDIQIKDGKLRIVPK